MSLLCCFLFCAGVSGAPADSSVLTVDEVVVTAERVRHPVRDVAASVSVLTSTELDRSLARSATAALAGLPGVFVAGTGQFGRTDIDIRGVGDQGTRIAVLVDGRPEKMSLFGCTVTQTLPMTDVERIEVVRGPLSVLYGSDAMAGVVNIVTRRATSPLELGTQLDYGSFNTRHGRLSVGTSQGRFNVLFTGDKAMSDGQLPNSQYNGNDLSLRAGYDASHTLQLDFTGKYFDGVQHEPKRGTDPDTMQATDWQHYQRGGLDLTATAGTDSLGGFAKVYRDFGEHRFDPTDGWHSTDFTNGILVHAQDRLRFGSLVQAGVEASELGGTWIQSDSSRPSWTRWQEAVFAQDEQTSGPVTANAGVRLAYDSISGPVLCPKVGLVGRVGTGTTLRASINRGFRFPPLDYTSIFPPMNDSLKPEVSWNYEAGVNQRVFDGLAADLDAFILRGENLIETATVPGRNPPVEFENKGNFSFKGIEAGLELRRGPWHGNLAYSLTDFGVNTCGRPGAKLDVSAGATVKRLDLDLTFQRVGRYYAADSSASPIPDYATLDFRAGYRLLSWLGLFGAVENVLDAHFDTYADLPGTGAGLYQMPGRSFTLGLNLEKR